MAAAITNGRETNLDKDGRSLSLKAALELRLGLPGTHDHHHRSAQKNSTSTGNKRSSLEMDDSCRDEKAGDAFARLQCGGSPLPKTQVVGWPPVGSFRKNQQHVLTKLMKPESDVNAAMFVKVSMDGAPFLRKIHLASFSNYLDLLMSLQTMFKCTIAIDERSDQGCVYNGKANAGEYAATYEDKDGDWMLVGDVPWHMFVTSCKRLRIMKGSEAKGA